MATNKVKLLQKDYDFALEEEVNKFIKDKDVINISYSVAPCGRGYIYCACILYCDIK